MHSLFLINNPKKCGNLEKLDNSLIHVNHLIANSLFFHKVNDFNITSIIFFTPSFYSNYSNIFIVGI